MVYKRIAIMLMVCLAVLGSAFSTAPYFFSQSPTLSYDPANGLELNYDIGDDDGFGVNVQYNIYVSNACGTDTFLGNEAEPLTYNARDAVLYSVGSINPTSINTNGDYYVEVILENVNTMETFTQSSNVVTVSDLSACVPPADLQFAVSPSLVVDNLAQTMTFDFEYLSNNNAIADIEVRLVRQSDFTVVNTANYFGVSTGFTPTSGNVFGLNGQQTGDYTVEVYITDTVDNNNQVSSTSNVVNFDPTTLAFNTPTSFTIDNNAQTGTVFVDLASNDPNFLLIGTVSVRYDSNNSIAISIPVNNTVSEINANPYVFDLSGLPDGDYYGRPLLIDEATGGTLFVFEESNRQTYTAPAQSEQPAQSGNSFETVEETTTGLFGVIGAIVSSVVVLMTGDLLTLSIVGSFILFIIGVIALLSGAVKGFVNQSTRKK